jgi:hypothetical protein
MGPHTGSEIPVQNEAPKLNTPSVLQHFHIMETPQEGVVSTLNGQIENDRTSW